QAFQKRGEQRGQDADRVQEQGPEAGKDRRARRQHLASHQSAQAGRIQVRRRVPRSGSQGNDRREINAGSRGQSRMGNALFIVWRESAEAMLVVGILYAWLKRRSDATIGMRYLWGGVAAGIGLALALAVVMLGIASALSESALDYF